MLLTLDKGPQTPKSVQILEQVRGHIESGALRTGERLPSTRHLAEQLGVHRSTVATAYQELWAQGWIELRSGTCPSVRSRTRLASPAEPGVRREFEWGTVCSDTCEALLQTHLNLHARSAQSDCISFAHLVPDPRLMPTDAFRACLNRVLRLKGPELLGYGDRQGYRPLREYLARRLRRHGISTSAEEILITNGSQHGLDLVLRMLAAPGRTVAVESPTYSLALPLIRLSGMEPLEIPIGPEGLDLQALEVAFQSGSPTLVYTMPNFQNPTGFCTSQAHRERLLALCHRYGKPLIEDGFEEEMKYFGKAVLPIKSMDRSGLVIYCGTFSKVLFPGIRIGWLVADRACIERLTALRHFTDLSPAQPLQAGMHEFCERGHYDLHLSHMHRVFRKRMAAALRALREHIDPNLAQWEEPNGGYLIWMKLRIPSISGKELQRHFASHGVLIAPGETSFASHPQEPHLRLSISTLDESEIAEGIQRLGLALKALHVS